MGYPLVDGPWQHLQDTAEDYAGFQAMPYGGWPAVADVDAGDAGEGADAGAGGGRKIVPREVGTAAIALDMLFAAVRMEA